MLNHTFLEFIEIIKKLRSEEGCPWDREQTHDSLKICLIEECYEVIEAIENKDTDNLKEELGDILLQVVMHSVIAEEEGVFTIDDVVDNVKEKMIRRHPHVFGEIEAHNTEEVLSRWEEIKKQEKKSKNKVQEILDVPRAFPAVIRAGKVLKKVSKEFPHSMGDEEVFKGLEKGLKNIKKTAKNGDSDLICEEYGKLMLSFINLSLLLHINAENSLTNATNEFINRFVDVFTAMQGEDGNLCDISPGKLWGDM